MNIAYFIDNAPETISSSFIHREHKKGSSILYPGERNNYLYIIIAGSANVIVQNYSGAGILLYTYNAYSCFGELELFNNEIMTFNVISDTDCELLILHKNKVFEWMQIDFEFTKFIIKQLAEKLLNSSQKLATISLLSVTDRLLYSIYTHNKIGDLSSLTKQAVCLEACIPIRSLNRAIAECKNKNFIDFNGKQFHIISLENLETHCATLL